MEYLNWDKRTRIEIEKADTAAALRQDTVERYGNLMILFSAGADGRVMIY